MTDVEQKRIQAICKVAHIDDISDLSDGYHTFKQLYYQRMILFAALVKQNRDKAWKSLRHEDGGLCFGGGWFIVGIDTPEGSYTYHYENKYWNMFECVDLPRAKHWDGHTEEDAETRLMSLEPERWIPVTERLPKREEDVLVTRFYDGGEDSNKPCRYVEVASCYGEDEDVSWYSYSDEYKRSPRSHHVIAWMLLPAPYREEGDQE